MTNDQIRTTRRAMDLWPRLDREKLRRAGGDPRRIARLVARRTALPVDTILRMLVAADAPA